MNRGNIMEINRLGLQALYGATPGASAAGNATGMGAVGERGSGRDEAREAAASQPAPSTRVMLSAGSQSMLAAEQQRVTDARQSAAVPQNMPVQNTGETERLRNEAASFTASAPAIAQRPAEAVPMQQASTTRPTGAPAPESQAAAATPAAAPAPAQPPRDMAPAQPPQAQAGNRAESMAQQNRARQDVSPMLAQSGLASYRQVLSL